MSQTPSKRRMRGFEPASGLVRDPLRKAGEARGFSVTRLLTQWAEVVGEDIAAQTLPVRVSYGRGGLGATLTLLTSGPAAPIMQMQSERIRERVNACYGYNAVSRVVLTQTAPTGFAEGRAVFRPAPKAQAPAPDPALLKRAEAAVSAVSDPDLRSALAILGQNVLLRAKRAQDRDQTDKDTLKG